MKAVTGAVLLCGLLVLACADNPWQITAKDMATAVAQSKRFTGTESQATVELWFEQWRAMHGKTYANSAARQQALANFRQTLVHVHTTNTNPKAISWVGVGPFADTSFDQFQNTILMRHWNASVPHAKRQRLLGEDGSMHNRRLMKGKPAPAPKPSPTPAPAPSPALVPSPSPALTPSPASAITVDWRSTGKVTPIKDQGGCGSCWAFAATASIESAYLISAQTTASASPIDLAEQQLVDCANSAAGYYSSGCNGGYSDYAIQYVQKVNETTETRYPYTATTNACNMAVVQGPAGTAVELASSVTYIAYNSYTALMSAVNKQPVVIYFDVVADFQSYAGGIYTATTCGTSVNHAMVVVGYYWTGSLDTSYWIIRNSWGTYWGESGYMRVSMSSSVSTGPCGMYQYPMVPTLSSPFLVKTLA